MTLAQSFRFCVSIRPLRSKTERGDTSITNCYRVKQFIAKAMLEPDRPFARHLLEIHRVWRAFQLSPWPFQAALRSLQQSLKAFPERLKPLHSLARPFQCSLTAFHLG